MLTWNKWKTHQLKVVHIKFNKGINVNVFPNICSAQHGKRQCFSKLGSAVQKIQVITYHEQFITNGN